MTNVTRYLLNAVGFLALTVLTANVTTPKYGFNYAVFFPSFVCGLYLFQAFLAWMRAR